MIRVLAATEKGVRQGKETFKQEESGTEVHIDSLKMFGVEE